MEPRQLTILGLLLLLGAGISAAVPEHPLFNQAGGKYLLALMAISCWLAAILIKARRAVPR